jgi:hypothetical protein
MVAKVWLGVEIRLSSKDLHGLEACVAPTANVLPREHPSVGTCKGTA